MSDSATIQKSSPVPDPRRRRFARWLAKLVLWFISLVAVVTAIVAAVALIAYWNLTGLANYALSRFAAPYQIELGRVDVSRRGLIRLEEARIRPPKDFKTAGDVPWVTLAGIDLEYDWEELWNEHRFRSIVLKHPAIHLDDTSLQVLGLTGKPGESETGEQAPPFDLKSLGRVTDRIEVVSGDLTIDTSLMPKLVAEWDASIPAIDFAADDWLNSDPFSLRFSKLQIGPDGGGGSIDRIALAGRVRSDLRGIEIARLGIDHPRLNVTPAWFSGAESESAPAKQKRDDRAGFQILLGVFEVKGAELTTGGFAGAPPVSLATEIDWRDLSIEGGTVQSGLPLTLAVSDLKIGELAKVGRITTVFDPKEAISRGRIESIVIDSPRLMLTPETLALPMPSKATEEPKAVPVWEIGSVTLREGSLEAREWRAGERKIPDFRVAGIEADLVDLSPTAFERGDAPQSLSLTGIQAGNEKAGPLSVEVLAAKFRFGPLLKEKKLDSLAIAKPVLRVTDEALPDWLGNAGEAESEVSEAEEPAAIWTVEDLSVTDGDLWLDTRTMDGRLPKLDGKFSIAKAPGAEGNGTGEKALYRLQLQRLRVRQPADTEPVAAPAENPGGLFPGDAESKDDTAPRSIGDQDVALLRELSIDFTAAGLQRERRIDRVEVKAQMQVGDALRSLVKGAEGAVEIEHPTTPDSGAPLQQSPQAASGKKPWKIGELVVTESQVRFQALVKGLEGLEFGIETKLMEVPLSQEGLLAQDARQKVEIAGIEIRDPYDGFITVAVLPTIFVEFSLSGLLQQRIDKIDLLNPALHVGQGMFWWVEYQRKHRQQNEGTSFVGAGAAPVAGAEAAPNNWEIREINAHFGKIVIAPVGRPIGIVPFPFSASTNLNKGEIALKLQIPKEQQHVYRFPDLKLDLYGLEGNVEFNVPIKQQSNNLVQTFKLDRAVWKQHEARDLFLSVTYDQNGVYGRFGGSAYGGYAEGQFNAYFSELGKWDAWIAGTKMDMGPITGVLAPENFLMEGKIDAKLISQGKGLEFGETWGELRTLTPGRIDVTKVNELIEHLPDSWSEMKRSATQLGLETIKDFDYEQGKGDLYFVNRDGWLKLDLRGAAGSRVLEAYAHDWRAGRGGDKRSIEEKLAEYQEKAAGPSAPTVETIEAIPEEAPQEKPARPAQQNFRRKR